MGATTPEKFAQQALERPLPWRSPDAGLVHHSDGHLQYAANDCRRKREAPGTTVPMRAAGDCWDNAPMGLDNWHVAFAAPHRSAPGQVRTAARAAQLHRWAAA